MDRLYVPIPRDRVTTIAVFDACASAYDLLIDAERNIRNISRLLNVIEAGSPSRDAVLRVLDFGCGTGLSLQAVARQARPWRFRLVGLDASPHMRAIAGSRGLEVVMGDEVQAYDGVFASYVLHGVLGPYDLRWIASVLSDKGVFAGNWLHGDDNVMQSFLEALGRRRQGRGATLKDPALWPRDPMITFLVDEG
jgi:SAM-dependent methyltransferase